MEEQKLKEVPVMSEEEFMKYIKADMDLEKKVNEDFNKGIIHLHFYNGVSRFKSVRRAIRRGLVSPYGEIYPKRPFNNRGHNGINELKKQLYGQVKRSQKC